VKLHVTRAIFFPGFDRLAFAHHAAQVSFNIFREPLDGNYFCVLIFS
jgi:hypothetical protein